MPEYFHLAEIFGDSVADGRVGFAANDLVLNSPPPDTLVGGEDEVDINATRDEVGEDHISTRKRHNSDIGISSRHTKKRTKRGGGNGRECRPHGRCG